MALGVNSPLKYSTQQIFNGLIPREGPRAIPVPLLFGASNSLSFDFYLQNEGEFLSYVQCIWADNSNNTAPLIITWNASQQTTIIPPRAQGYVPVLVLKPVKMTVSCASMANAQVTLLNVPMPTGIWATQQFIPNFDVNGNLLVSDVLLEGTVSGNRVQVANSVRGNNDVVEPEYLADNIQTGTRNTAGQSTVLAATANMGWFVTAFEFGFTGDATVAAAAAIVVDLRQAGGAVIAQQNVFLPATGAPFANTGVIPVMRFDRVNHLASAANVALQVNLGTALTAGALWWRVACGYTSVIRV